MGCICSKGASQDEPTSDHLNEKDREKEKEMKFSMSSVQLVAPAPSMREEVVVDVSGRGGGGGNDGSVRPVSRTNAGAASAPVPSVEGERNTVIVERPKKGHRRGATIDMGGSGDQSNIYRIGSMPRGSVIETGPPGWPSWLTSVAGEAIKGWMPRRAESFEKLEKIGQGTYSTVYRARDLETGKIVAMKKVRFVNMDPESVRFMAREILILRKLDHPNVMKLESVVTSWMSDSLYLVFEYMEHDLAGLAATPGIKFTEPQIKCFMQQLLHGLEHCHSRGVLHRDIKGSNLLIDSNGVLKLGDFGLANFYQPDQKQPLTSRVVTLWYRAPELLFGATEYGVSVDLWSAGCILAELFAGKPIMPGRTEVEQMHKIFKLCGSPSEDFWRTTKLPLATSFKPQQPYKPCLAETFKNFPPSALALVDKLLSMKPDDRGSAASSLTSEFFQTVPLPCDPSRLPKYPPSKELDAKLRDEEARRQRAEAVKGRGPESVRRGSRDFKVVPTPEFMAQGQQKNISTSHKYGPQEDGGTGFPIEPRRANRQNGYTHPNSMIHPIAAGSSLKNVGSARNNAELRMQSSHMPQAAVELSNSSLKKDEMVSTKEASMGYVPRKSRIHYSGPLMPPGGNIEDILKEHERQIQHAVRKARFVKPGTNKGMDGYGQQQLKGRHGH